MVICYKDKESIYFFPIHLNSTNSTEYLTKFVKNRSVNSNLLVVSR